MIRFRSLALSMASNELFTVPIAPFKTYPEGSIICTSPAPQIYVLTWASPPDNRLTSAFNAALLTALDVIEFGHPPGVVITTSAITKFYSNGLDLKLALSVPDFMETSLYPLYRRLLTYPMPTVALINGHGFAGGLMLAMHHDYRVFTDARGYVCVNELEFGAPLTPAMSSIFRIKLAPRVYRDLVLEARRFDAETARDAGIVDAVGELDAALLLIQERGLVKKGTTGVYGTLKGEMYRESVALLSDKDKTDAAILEDWKAAERKRKSEGYRWVKKWQEVQDFKAKL
ncbi:enoyl-CoA hydratase/isomerase family protein [Xylariaceae sp. FL0662B]|nr:enoyl-CoA hydratase/isomerase family protein [Xylariaceae sp. FL0662B]